MFGTSGRLRQVGEIATFEIELDKGTEAKEVFGDDFKNKLKILFDKDWKRLKK